MKRLERSYFQSSATVSIARDLIGKTLVRDFGNNQILRAKIIETEAYVGEEDLACHASKGRTKRTELMYQAGGVVYVILYTDATGC